MRNGSLVKTGVIGNYEWAEWSGYYFNDGTPITNPNLLGVTEGIIDSHTDFAVIPANVGETFFQQDYWVLGNVPNVTPAEDLVGQKVIFTGNLDPLEAYTNGGAGYVGIQFLDTGYQPTPVTVWVDVNVDNPAGDGDGIFMDADEGLFSIEAFVPDGINLVQAQFKNVSTGPTSTGAMRISTTNAPLGFVVEDPSPLD
jgi:hypothetical protein